MPLTTFADLRETLNNVSANCDAAECHGTLCGVLCVGADAGDGWLEHILGADAGGEAAQACRQLLLTLRDGTRTQLNEGALEFAPILPPDEATLQERAAALGEWCQGFLYGMGLGGEGLHVDALADEAGEVLRDMTQIAQVGLEGETENEEDEVAYTEIVEYLRVGVQLLYEELQPATAHAVPPASTLH